MATKSCKICFLSLGLMLLREIKSTGMPIFFYILFTTLLKSKSEKQFKGLNRSKIKTYLVQNPLGGDDALPLIALGFLKV